LRGGRKTVDIVTKLERSMEKFGKRSYSRKKVEKNNKGGYGHFLGSNFGIGMRIGG